ncbi:MAG: aromatic amino acid transport family protein [Parachlamydiales bacterium]|jgi:tyrosine-specific transport protein
MNEQTLIKTGPVSFWPVFSGTLFIAGSTIGAGMLGLPSVSAALGFFPALLITLIVWLFMYATGLLVLEAALSMPLNANLMSISLRFLKKPGAILTFFSFLFLYYCLMVAYFASGVPIVLSFFPASAGFFLAGWKGYFLFGFGLFMVVAFGLKLINRINYILMIGLVLSYLALTKAGFGSVQFERLFAVNLKQWFWLVPILFSAFGYHNVIPSLVAYYQRDRKVLHLSIFLGTLFALLVYLLWQWVVLGNIDQKIILNTAQAGLPVTKALESATGNPHILLFGRFFGFFALATSLLGVAFSMIDFLGDTFHLSRQGRSRFGLAFLTILPPFLITILKPELFLVSLGLAGGFGEALLNGILPVVLVWSGRYHGKGLKPLFFKKKGWLVALLVFGILVMLLEAYILLN